MNQIPNIEETHSTREIEEINNYLDYTVHNTCEYHVYSDLKDLVANIEVAHHHQLQKAREEERERITNQLEGLLWELDSMDALGIATPEHLGERIGLGKAKAITRNHSELDQDNK